MNLKGLIVRDQNLGEFFICTIRMRDLVELTSVKRRLVDNEGNSTGIQREILPSRIKEIEHFISSSNSSIPNSLILSLDFDESEEDVKISKDSNEINVEFDPQNKNVTFSIIDGQHRIEAFRELVNLKSKIDFDVPCSVYINLPEPLQGYIFATINYNQKPVNKSLALDLFNYYYDSEIPDNKKTPLVLAVYIARTLSFDKEEPNHLYGKIVVIGAKSTYENEFKLSLSTFSKGVCSLFSKSQKSDNMELNKNKKTRAKLLDDGTPLRDLYIHGEDSTIYLIVKNFFNGILGNMKDRDKRLYFSNIGLSIQFEIFKECLTALIKKGATDFSLTFFLSSFADLEVIIPDDVEIAPNSNSKNLARELYRAAITKCLNL